MTYIQQKICSQAGSACYTEANALQYDDYLDIDYDAISQSLVLGVFQHQHPHRILWNGTLPRIPGDAKVEVGVLAYEKPTKPEEISLGGFLTVIGEDSEPSRYTAAQALAQILTVCQAQLSSRFHLVIMQRPRCQAQFTAPHL